MLIREATARKVAAIVKGTGNTEVVVKDDVRVVTLVSLVVVVLSGEYIQVVRLVSGAKLVGQDVRQAPLNSKVG